MNVKQLLFLGLAFIIISCDEREVGIPEINNECSDKVILIEELTGVSCSNCPKGTNALKQIFEVFPDKVVVVAVHGSLLAEPLSNSKYDFRSELGAEMENFYNPWLGKPAAAFDRFQFEDFEEGVVFDTDPDIWLSRVETRCKTPQSIDIILSSSYDADNRLASITATAVGVEPTEGEIRMNIFITESNLIDPQDAGGVDLGIVDDYEHNHIMRDRLSILEGDFLITDLSVDQQVSKTYTYTLPEEDNGQWMVENMEVIAFVTEGDQSRGQVLQAAQVYLD